MIVFILTIKNSSLLIKFLSNINSASKVNKIIDKHNDITELIFDVTFKNNFKSDLLIIKNDDNNDKNNDQIVKMTAEIS